MSPNFRSFGNASEEIYYGILLSERLKKKILFIFPRIGIISISNKELFYLEHDNIISHKSILSISLGVLFEIYVLTLWLIDVIKCSPLTRNIFSFLGYNDSEFIKRDFGYIIPTIGKEKLWIPDHNIKYCSNSAAKLNWPKQYKNFQPPKINIYKLEKGKKFLNKLGLTKNDWYVCLHVREKKNQNEMRNSKIKDYYPAIKYITERGGFVIRIGDSTSPGIPKMNNVIDYTKIKNRNPLMDLVIISECKYILGTSSGPNMVAHLFNRPVLGSNLTEWSHSISFCKFSILKHFYSKKEKKILSITEMLKEPYHIQRLGNYPHEDYNLIDNSPEEIKLLAKAGLDKDKLSNVSVNQEEFDKIKFKYLLDHLYKFKIQDWHGLSEGELLTQKYRFFAMSMFEGVIEKNFLDKNWK